MNIIKSNAFKFSIISFLVGLLSFIIITFGVTGFGTFVNSHQGTKHFVIELWHNRMKVLIMALFSGGALGVAGAILQKVTKNSLADVSILGIGSINIIFITGYIMLFKDKIFTGNTTEMLLPLVTLVASLSGTLIVWFFSRSKKGGSQKFIIVGISLQLLFEALAVVMIDPSKTTNDPESIKLMATIKDYTVGMINTDTSWWIIGISSSAIGIIFAIIIMLRQKIDLIEANEDLATTLGIKVGRIKFVIYVMVAVLAAAEAVMVGSVALLGIMAPAMARLLFKNKTGLIVPASFMIGGLMVMAASIVSLTLGTQLPIGLLATAIIIPYFIYVIVRSK